LAYNAHVTGNPLQTPLSASDPLNRFGFGERRILPGQGLIDYSFPKALTALGENVRAVPSWLLGGAGLILLAAIAMLRPTRRARRLVLVALVVAFPAGYLFWWATSLSASNAANGIGPHYYLPVFAPIAALAASTLTLVWVRRRVFAIALLM